MTEQSLTPIAPARVAQELTKLAEARRNQELAADEYEHRFARMVSELRDRKIAGTRAEILDVLTPLQVNGTVTPTDWHRLMKSLGLA